MGELKFKELVKENVEGITDDQMGKLETIFNNKMGEVHRRYDSDIEAATGSTKPANTKTHIWLKEAFAAKDALVTQGADKLTALNVKLTEALKSGANSEEVTKLQQDVADAQAVSAQLRTTHKTELSEWEKKVNSATGANTQLRLKSELVGLTFRDDIPADLLGLATSNAIAKVAGYKSETDANGTTIYRDANNSIMLNNKNSAAPFTGKELLLLELGSVLKTAKDQQGGGTGSGGDGSGQGDSFRITSTTKLGAMDEITKHLHTQGIKRDDPRHQQFVDKAWTDNNVSSLPRE